jgi:hypothetical protein
MKETTGGSGASVLQQLALTELHKTSSKIIQNFLFAALYLSWCSSSAGSSAIKTPGGSGLKVSDKPQDLLSPQDSQLSQRLLLY